MQRAFATDTHPTAGPRAKVIAIIAALAVLMLALAPATHAQESTPETTSPATPAAAPTGDSLGEVLIQHDVSEMPNAPMTVRLLRITLDPGASVPMHTHPGLEFDYIESGTLTTRSEGASVVSVGGQQSETTEPQTLSAGDWVHYPNGIGMNLANEGDEPLVLLSAVVLSVGADTESTITYTEGEPNDADFEGVSFVVLGDGLIQQFPSGGATVIVDELTVAAGQPIEGFAGVALLSKSSGTFAFAAGEGLVQVTRTATPRLEPNAIPGQEFTLADNDAAFFPAGFETIERPDSTDDVTFTRLLIQPSGEMAEAPASVTTIQAAATATEAQQPTGDGLGVGAIVAVSADSVNVRSEATTESDIVDSFPAGTQFEIIGGPEEGEGYTWYEVRGVGDLSNVEGWLVTDFMDVIEPAPGGAQPSTPTPAASGTPAAGGTPVAEGEFQVGDTVTTTVEALNVRSEPSTSGEVVDQVFPGSGMEIVGGPEEAEDFTWYEVEVVDTGSTGWVASDFIEAADDE
jgi:quercetin dioxygenase-like cupin family protein/uncharacterized protein YgiM (DUF1202 family)